MHMLFPGGPCAYASVRSGLCCLQVANGWPVLGEDLMSWVEMYHDTKTCNGNGNSSGATPDGMRAARARYHSSVNADLVDAPAPGYRQAGSPGTRAKSLKATGSIAGSNPRDVYAYGRRDVTSSSGTLTNLHCSPPKRGTRALQHPDGGYQVAPRACVTCTILNTTGVVHRSSSIIGTFASITEAAGCARKCGTDSRCVYWAIHFTQGCQLRPDKNELYKTKSYTGGHGECIPTVIEKPAQPGPLSQFSSATTPCHSASEEAWAAWSQPKDPFKIELFHTQDVPVGSEVQTDGRSTRILVQIAFLPNDPTVYLGLGKMGYVLKFQFNTASDTRAPAVDDPDFVWGGKSGKIFGGYVGKIQRTCATLQSGVKTRPFWCTLCDDSDASNCIKDRCAASCGWGTVGVILPAQVCHEEWHNQSGCRWSTGPRRKEYNGIGLAVDPDFATTGHVYVMRAPLIPRPSIQITRFTARGFKAGDALSGKLEEGTIIWEDSDPWPYSAHPGGSLVATPEGHLHGAFVHQYPPTANTHCLLY